MQNTKKLTEYLTLKKNNNEPIIVAYLPALYPNKKISKKWIKLLLNNGVDAVELGFPSKKPEMDGKLISEAHQHIYENAFETEMYNELAKELISELKFNRLIAMGYWHQIKDEFLEKILDEWKDIGLTSMIFPDLENQKMTKSLKENGFSIIPFIDSKEKIKDYNPGDEPFIYCPTYLGKTGQSSEINKEFLKRLKNSLNNSRLKNKPHLAGFGISSGKDARQVIDLGFDGIIVGSAFLEKFNHSEERAISLLNELKRNIGKE